jgi:hypothetical protein
MEFEASNGHALVPAAQDFSGARRERRLLTLLEKTIEGDGVRHHARDGYEVPAGFSEDLSDKDLDRGKTIDLRSAS